MGIIIVMPIEYKKDMTSTLKDSPADWGKDSVSEFIEIARNNMFATFSNLPQQYNVLKDINGLYKYVIDNLINSPEWFATFFLLRSHSAYLGSVRFAISGQCAETYMVLRGCLEAAIYGLYLSRNEGSQKVWLSRHDDGKSLKRVKEEFKMVKLLNFLESIDRNIYKTTKLLYDRTIDYGAHPNELALTSLLRKTEEESNIHFNLDYLSGNTPALHLAIKTTAQVGLCSLSIFKNVYRERFQLLGVDERLKKLKGGL